MNDVLELAEWDRGSVALDNPSSDDLALISNLQNGLKRKLEFSWSRSGRLNVRSTSWVGVVRLGGCTINIRPKYAGDELGVLKMLAYAGDYRGLKRIGGTRQLPTKGVDLLDLLCFLLAGEAELLLRDGLMHDYSTEEQSLTTLRGTLRFRDQATRRFGQLDQLECRFDEFHANVIENQLVRAGLGAAARFCSDREVRRRLLRVDAALADVSDTGPMEPSYYRSRIAYGRRNERYRQAHELALLIIAQLGVDDLYSASKTESFAFLLDMNTVFESFMTALIAEAFHGEQWSLVAQKRVGSVIRNRETGKRYSSIIPDVVMTSRSETVPFDCKYKLYGPGKKKLSPDDIYQCFLYAYAMSAEGQRTRAGLIYPSGPGVAGPHLDIRRVDGPLGAELTGVGVDLVAVLSALDDSDRWQSELAELRATMTQILEPVAA